MAWIPCRERLPETEGVYFVYAPSADPDRPFFATAWFNFEQRGWELIPHYWAVAITHWMKPEKPEA